jgi:hypothetical protein
MKYRTLLLIIATSLSGCATIPDLEPEDRLACGRSPWGFHGALCSRTIQLHKQELAAAHVQAFLDDGSLFGINLESNKATCRPKHQTSDCDALAAFPWYCDVEVCDSSTGQGCGYIALVLEGEETTESDLDTCSLNSPCGIAAPQRRVNRAVERALDGAEAEVVLEFRKVDDESQVLWCATTTENPRRRVLVDAASGETRGVAPILPSIPQ